MFGLDLVLPFGRLGVLEHVPKCCDQIEDSDFYFTLGVGRPVRTRSNHAKNIATEQPAPGERFSRFLESLILKQAMDQLGTRVDAIFFFIELVRQEHPTLDQGQSGGHDEVLGSDVEIEFLHELDRVQVLRGDMRNRNIRYVDFVLSNQMKQEIQRTFEDGELDGIAVESIRTLVRLVTKILKGIGRRHFRRAHRLRSIYGSSWRLGEVSEKNVARVGVVGRQSRVTPDVHFTMHTGNRSITVSRRKYPRLRFYRQPFVS